MLPNFEFARPTSLTELFELLKQENVRVHAGGTDLLGCLRDEVFSARSLVSLSALSSLRGVSEAGGGLRIGAMTTVAELAEHPKIGARYAALVQAAREVASPQLRNQGTLGGNLCQKPRCWYYRGDFHCLRKGGDQCFALEGENAYHCIFAGDGCYIVHPSDLAPALAALDATVWMVSPAGTRSVPVARFHISPAEDAERETMLEPGEIITEIRLPAPAPGLRSSYRKIRARQSWDFALAGVALALSMAGDRVRSARVFLSGAAPIPWRARGVEVLLEGQQLTPATIQKAAAVSVEGAEPLAQNAYKLALFPALLEEQLAALAEG